MLVPMYYNFNDNEERGDFMFFFFNEDEKAPEDAPRVYRVNEISDCKLALDNLKKLNEGLENIRGQKRLNVDASVSYSDAIKEQEKQIKEFSNSADFNNKKLRDNITYLLDKNNIQINTLETVLELSPGYISRTLGTDAKKKLSIDVVCKMANLFQVNIESLLYSDFTEPVKDVKKVSKFLNQLKEDTDGESIHWKRIESSSSESDELFYKWGSEEDRYYCPITNCSKIVSVNDIFMVEVNIGIIFLIKGKGLFDEDCYDMLQIDKDEYYSSKKVGFKNCSYSLNLITSNLGDRSGILNNSFEKLYKSIKLHESDFIISKTANYLIDKFMENHMPF